MSIDSNSVCCTRVILSTLRLTACLHALPDVPRLVFDLLQTQHLRDLDRRHGVPQVHLVCKEQDWHLFAVDVWTGTQVQDQWLIGQTNYIIHFESHILLLWTFQSAVKYHHYSFQVVLQHPFIGDNEFKMMLCRKTRRSAGCDTGSGSVAFSWMCWFVTWIWVVQTQWRANTLILMTVKY